jgi:hypothetical protein
VEPDTVFSEFVEFTIRDQYVGRSEMWRLKKKLVGDSIYVGEKVTYSGCIGAIVKAIYVNGEKVMCPFDSFGISYEVKCRSEAACSHKIQKLYFDQSRRNILFLLK